jgi:hypothetical protein
MWADTIDGVEEHEIYSTIRALAIHAPGRGPLRLAFEAGARLHILRRKTLTDLTL